MAIVGQITGPPGSGKTFSLINLNPSTVFFIDADRKGMAWTGWRKDYSVENKNYFATANPSQIASVLRKVSDSMPHVQVVVVDTINSIMSKKEMAERKKNGFDKWMEMAGDIFDLYELAYELRDDLIVLFVAHSQPYEVNGTTLYRTLVNGQKLSKLNLASKITYNLYSDKVNEGDGIKNYFITRSDVYNEARSVHGVLPDRMENDLSEVVRLIREKDLMIKD